MSIQRTFYATADVAIEENLPGERLAYPALQTAWSAGKRGIVKFDLSDIPDAASVNAVTLRLKRNSAPNNGSNSTVSVYGMLRDWVETQADWGVYSTGNNWASSGAMGEGDITAAVGSVYPYDWGYMSSWTHEWAEFPVAATTAELKAWYGFLIAADLAQYEGTFYGRESGASYAPQLVVTYVSGDAAITGRLFLPLSMLSRFYSEASDGSGPKLCYYARNLQTLVGKPNDASHHHLIVSRSDGVTAAPWRSPRDVDATSAPGLCELPLTAAEANQKRLSLAGTSDTADVSIEPVLNVEGPSYAGGRVDANMVSIANSEDAAENLKQDIQTGYARGIVVASGGGYGYGYGYGCVPTVTVFCTTLPLREDSVEIGTSGLYRLGYARMEIRVEDPTLGPRYIPILKSETVDGYTRITVMYDHLPTAPAANTPVTVAGCTQPEAPEA